MVVGIAQLLAPDATLNLWRPYIVGNLFGAPPHEIYILGTLTIVLGLFLLYIGITRLVQLSWFVVIIGVLAFIAGLLIVIMPDLFRDTVNSLIYTQPERIRRIINYVSGAVRFAIGFIFLIIALSPAPVRRRV